MAVLRNRIELIGETRSMRIVIANKYFYPRGGDCQYTLRLIQLLESHGHEVAPFSMHHPDNLRSEYETYFVEHIDFQQELADMNLAGALHVLSRSVSNRKAVGLFRQLIEDFKPDIIHLQNIHHQLTPAIIGPAIRKSIPVVWTLHDYNILCPDHAFLRKDRLCMKCSTGGYYHAIVNRCKKGSLGASILAALECAVHNPWKLSKRINKFICPSSFMARLLAECKIPRDKIVHVPPFLPDPKLRVSDGDYFIYAGRLSAEKGLSILVEAFRRLPQTKLVVIGDGPLKNDLHSFIENHRLENVKLVGFQSPENVQKIMAGCMALVMPSICLENMPYAIIEAMACAKPVIASNLGGMPEMVEHGENGLLFEPGDVDSLVNCVNQLVSSPESARNMGLQGAEIFRRRYSVENHYRNIMKVYNMAFDNNIEFPYSDLHDRPEKGKGKAITQL